MTTPQDQQSRAEFEQSYRARNDESRLYCESEWRGWQAARALPAGVTPDELKARCAEILEWHKTGLLPGNALRDFAAEKYPEHHDALQMAERATAQEAFALLAAAPQPPAAPKVPTEDTTSYLAQMFGPGPAPRPPAAQERKPLTDEAITKLWVTWVGTQRPNYSFTRAVEAAHGIEEGGSDGAEPG